jgi:uncharacterized membrane-anchored protein YjiN (DUF445 family)
MSENHKKVEQFDDLDSMFDDMRGARAKSSESKVEPKIEAKTEEKSEKPVAALKKPKKEKKESKPAPTKVPKETIDSSVIRKELQTFSNAIALGLSNAMDALRLKLDKVATVDDLKQVQEKIASISGMKPELLASSSIPEKIQDYWKILYKSNLKRRKQGPLHDILIEMNKWFIGDDKDG